MTCTTLTPTPEYAGYENRPVATRPERTPVAVERVAPSRRSLMQRFAGWRADRRQLAALRRVNHGSANRDVTDLMMQATTVPYLHR